MTTDIEALVDRLNDPCRDALEAAAARSLGNAQHHVEVEHYLACLLDHQDGELRHILELLDVNVAILRDELDEAVDACAVGCAGIPGLSWRLERLLDVAWARASLELRANRIRAGAVLWALLDDEVLRKSALRACPALEPAARRSAGPGFGDAVRSAATSRARGRRAASASEVPAAVSVPVGEALLAYTIDLTEEARAGRIDPILGRDDEVRQVIDILTRRRQNNPILVGEAGVGKTAVVEGLARRVARGEVPEPLRTISLRVLDTGLLQAGASARGEFEARLKAVIAEVSAAPQPIVLFIDEAHTLIGAGGAQGVGDAANLLKPALARGELRTIGATTWAEYKKYIEKDSALARRFQLVKVDEPDEDSAIDMLRGLAPTLERHHGVRIRDEAVRSAVTASIRYLPDRRLPDKAISVLDTAAARVALARHSTPPAVDELNRLIGRAEAELAVVEREGPGRRQSPGELSEQRSQLDELRRQRQELVDRWSRERDLAARIGVLEEAVHAARLERPGAPDAAGVAADPIDDILDDAVAEDRGDPRAELEQLKSELSELQGEAPMVPLAVDARVVASVVSDWTGVPVGRVVTDEVSGLLQLEQRLGERVVGQSHALRMLARRITTSRAGLEDPAKPKGVFLFVGPTGVGKTETALAVADTLYGGRRNLITVNMSEFQEAHSVASLKGAPPGYVGYGTGGVLTEAVRRRPHSVVLLDEVEKAHPDVLELFYQVFDRGLLEDGEGIPVDFRHTIIMLTSNVAADSITSVVASQEPASVDRVVEAIQPELAKVFPAAFLGRLMVVPYVPLGRADLRSIVTLKLRAIQDRLRVSHAATLAYDEQLVEYLASRSEASAAGARQIDHLLERAVLPPLSNLILESVAEGALIDRISMSVDTEGRGVSFELAPLAH
jgi:type VI secretion system protein VasG